MLEPRSLLTGFSSNISASGMSHPGKKNFLLKQSQIDLFVVVFCLLLSLSYLHYLAILGTSESAVVRTDA